MCTSSDSIVLGRVLNHMVYSLNTVEISIITVAIDDVLDVSIKVYWISMN